MRSMFDSPRRHAREYVIEGGYVFLLLFAACAYASALEYPGSPVHEAIPDRANRRVLMGVLMGTTLTALIYSPWGRRTGAHLNPATTLTFTRLGKVRPADAVFLILAQFAGAVTGIGVAALLLRAAVSSREVNFIATVPGDAGVGWAFAVETFLAFVIMSVVLLMTNTRRLHRFTGVVVAILLALFISVAAPISGMSVNPARSFASAVWSQLWTALWIYFVAPPLGMLLAAEIYRRIPGRQIICAKLFHDRRPCMFRCGYGLGHRDHPLGVDSDIERTGE
jgi:aquaporin Z